MYKKILYKKAYRMMEITTPLKFDCGLICNSKCCSGDNNSGMCLFPGEEVMFDKHDFLTIRKDKILETDVLFAVCNETCNRKFRPLSCRIFPYVPYLEHGSSLTIIEDPRARYMCPLLEKSFGFKIQGMFRRNILNAFRLLIQDDDIRNHVRLLSGVLDEYMKFMG